MVDKVAEMATAIGNTSVAATLTAKKAALVQSFNGDFFDSSKNVYDNGVMTTFTLPLHLNIVPAASKAAVQKNLLNQVTTTFSDHNVSVCASDPPACIAYSDSEPSDK